ncbi:MAG: hypothetical protein ABSB29_04535, partial [Nitrososphaerales archaeon]
MTKFTYDTSSQTKLLRTLPVFFLFILLATVVAPAFATSRTMTVTCTPTTGTVGVSEQCTGTVSGIGSPGGTISFSGGPSDMPASCSLPTGRSCSVTWTPASNDEATYTITATWSGDAQTTSNVALTIQTTTLTSVSCSPSPGTNGVSESCTATVTNGDSGYSTKATGTITFSG